MVAAAGLQRTHQLAKDWGHPVTMPDVLVIGAGPAGLSAVVELARLGLSSLLVEQRDQVGGAIYRRHVGVGSHVLLMPEHHRRRRDTLMQGFEQAQARVTPLFFSVFIGVDRDGRFLIDNRATGRVQSVRPKAVILALGTVERVLPREGWELPGVVTAGGMQVQFKETGQTPQGPILLAGSGPLLLALAAQLAAAGNPPLAVLEHAQPMASARWQGRAVVNTLRSWAHVQEAALYARELWRARVPYLTGWQVQSAQRVEDGLLVEARHGSGVARHYTVQHLALHDGLVPNATGLPAAAQAENKCVVHAGDCREVLGASAAIDDGRRAAQQVARHLGQRCDSAQLDAAIAAARRTQQALAQLFAAAPTSPTANTVVCRCEALRRTDFDRLQVAGSAHELRLVGRFGMGACQGRFCAQHLSAMAHERGIDFDPAALNGDVQRWPLRPVSLAALAAYSESETVL
ncbi:MAG: FAD-dependent oxidoreductase [Rhodoferax sp.]|uniref:FAD-dependent oxidoreductase n=1 Tax=Rhodoferax sp. TaxID=50421 RepID=UPI002618CE6B|nr:FAD-dependent oxidoreductase [Rhodoferax sp.]MDD2881245.1 FAD-dependent oxidoreductase [Rhodoferax sp.]